MRNCHIVAVDPGKNSGWSVWENGRLTSYGECDVYTYDPVNLLINVDWDAQANQLYPVLVIERPFQRRVGQGGFNTTNVGAADKIWREQARINGYSRRVVRVYPATWRAKVIGGGYHMAKRDKVKAKELEMALAVAHEAGLLDKFGDPGPEASPAILIGKWACQSTEVEATLPVRMRKAGT